MAKNGLNYITYTPAPKDADPDTMVRIDPQTGLVAPSGYGGAIFEIFEAGRVPELQTDEPGPIFSGTDPGSNSEDESLF